MYLIHLVFEDCISLVHISTAQGDDFLRHTGEGLHNIPGILRKVRNEIYDDFGIEPAELFPVMM